MRRSFRVERWSGTTRMHGRAPVRLAGVGVLGVCLCVVAAPPGGSGGLTPLAEIAGEYRDCGLPATAELVAVRRREGVSVGIDRFANDTRVWTGDGAIGPSGLAKAARLTYSFPDDGVQWGLVEVFNQVGPNDLNATLRRVFGPANLDLGREYVRQSLAAWAHVSGLSYEEVADDNTPLDTSTARTPTRGDVRLGGQSFFLAPFVAYNAFAANDGLTDIGGGDMVLNNSVWPDQLFGTSAADFHMLRVLVSHEHGHGLGMVHVVPCLATKLMEPFLQAGHVGLSIDAVRAAAAQYGDRYAGNTSMLTAHQFGDLTAPVRRSVIERQLSTNGAGSPLGAGEDWFAFVLSGTEDLTVRVAPTGGVYDAAEQIGGCFGDPAPLVDAQRAGRLSVEIVSVPDGAVLARTDAANAGDAVAAFLAGVGAGPYAVHVSDLGPNGLERVQLYDLEIRLVGAPGVPEAVAGIDKRVPVRTRCAFMGHLSSQATEAGAVLTAGSFDWDLDGDGVFETLGDPAPVHVYDIPGVVGVTLRVTDSNGASSTDTILVTVFEPLTLVDQITPDVGPQGDVVPVVLAGSHFENVLSMDQISVTGTGVSIVGVPAPNPAGTALEGLSFVVDPGATLGPRDVVVQTAIGADAAVGVFTVLPPRPEAFVLLSPVGGGVIGTDAARVQWGASQGADSYVVQLEVDLDDDGTVDQIVLTTPAMAGLSLTVPAGQLRPKTTYTWSVAAINASGARLSSPSVESFRTKECVGDANYDKLVDFVDIEVVIASWRTQFTAGRSGMGDANNDGVVDFRDITAAVAMWGASCP